MFPLHPFFLVVFLMINGEVKQFPYKEQGITLEFPDKALCDKALARTAKRAVRDGLTANEDFAMVCMQDDFWEGEAYKHRYDYSA